MRFIRLRFWKKRKSVISSQTRAFKDFPFLFWSFCAFGRVEHKCDFLLKVEGGKRGEGRAVGRWVYGVCVWGGGGGDFEECPRSCSLGV